MIRAYYLHFNIFTAFCRVWHWHTHATRIHMLRAHTKLIINTNNAASARPEVWCATNAFSLQRPIHANSEWKNFISTFFLLLLPPANVLQSHINRSYTLELTLFPLYGCIGYLQIYILLLFGFRFGKFRTNHQMTMPCICGRHVICNFWPCTGAPMPICPFI